MAFTKTPAQDTYKTEKVQLMRQMNSRAAAPTADEDYLNCFFEFVKNKEVNEQEANILKRDGSFSRIPAVAGVSIRGMYYCEDFLKLYYMVGSTMYIWNMSTGVAVAVIPAFFGTASGDIGFTEFLYDTGVVVVCVSDGTTLKTITNAEVVTTCVDPDLPVHIPSIAFLDGYLFVVKAGSSDIYNSDLNDPMLWTAGNFISAEIEADTVREFSKLNNYLVVFGSRSIEYFWDAGNATGSPLQRNDTPVKFNGYLGGLRRFGNKLYFAGNSIDGQPSVFMLDDFKIEEIGTASLTRYLNSLSITYNTWKGSVVEMQGHSFYVLNAGTTYTYVMDMDTKLWYRWSYQQTGLFPMDFSCNIKTGSTYQALFAMRNTTSVWAFSETAYQDDGVQYTTSGVTDNQYFDSYKQKTMSSLIVWADRPVANASFNIQWSDDDYQTYNTARTVNLFQERPNIDRLGRFRRRAFKWSFTENSPLRVKGFEVNINQGQN